MCGIVGFWSQGSQGPAAAEGEARLRRMVGLLRHRGPDDLAVWNEGGLGFGFVRLSILDLSPAGRQPMGDPETGSRLVYNGEIYNSPELRRELEAAGHRFRGHSDTEVLLLGYRQWGEAVLDRLRGMFAFALWDAPARRLLLARDRAGQKPLFFARSKDTFLFASEIKALLAWPGLSREPELEAIGDFFSFQAVPGPKTAFRGIEALLPAHLMTVESDGRTAQRRYWSLPRAEPQPKLRMAEAAAEFKDRLAEAVASQLLSDVPLGAFLSGGLDSGSVVLEMQRRFDRPVETFTIGFAEQDYDEREEAERLARQLGTTHRSVLLSPDAIDWFPALAWYFDQPFADPSSVPTYLVSRLAAERVKVVLTGDGGDEILFGYPRYRAALMARLAEPLPLPLRRGLAALARGLRLEARGATAARLGRLLMSLEQPQLNRYRGLFGFVGEEDREAAFGEALAPALAQSPSRHLAPWFAGAERDEEAGQRADFHLYLPDVILTKVDIASMANGLEARAPFLDHLLMEWVARLPTRLKLDIFRGKLLLRRALRGSLPADVLRQRKRGFGTPLDRWLAGPLLEMARELLLSRRSRERGYVRPAFAERLLADHLERRRGNHHRIWALMMLELWFRTWVDSPSLPTRPGALGAE